MQKKNNKSITWKHAIWLNFERRDKKASSSTYSTKQRGHTLKHFKQPKTILISAIVICIRLRAYANEAGQIFKRKFEFDYFNILQILFFEWLASLTGYSQAAYIM